MKKFFPHLICILALLALVAYFTQPTHGHGLSFAMAVMAGLPLLGAVGTIDDAAFQKTLLDGMEAQKTKTDTLVSNFENLSKETKSAFEDLTKLKKHANDSQAQFDATVRKLGDIESMLRREARGAFGCPIKRIQANEDLRLRLNMAVRMAMSDPGGDMVRLVKSKYPSELVKRAIGEDSSPGSTLINDALASEIYDTLSSFGVWNTFQVQRLGTKITKFPVKTARAAAAFILTEAGTVPADSSKAGSSVSLEVEAIGGIVRVSMQLLQDAEFDITADVMDDLGESIAEVMDHACLGADGTADATNGGMTGIFGGGGTAAAAAATHSTVETTVLEDWTKAMLTVDPVVLSRPARWWMHPRILVRALSVKDSNGRSVFLTANEAPTSGGLGSILGYPVTLAHKAPSTNAATAKVAVFGDPRGLVAGVRQDYTFEASDHANWTTFERSFRGIARFGTKIRRATAFGVLTLTA